MLTVLLQLVKILVTLVASVRDAGLSCLKNLVDKGPFAGFAFSEEDLTIEHKRRKYKMKLPDKIKMLRKKNWLSQHELADKIRITLLMSAD